MSILPALSIRQPWAWAIVHAGKTIENRSWSTRFRGRFLIHAGLRIDTEADAEFIVLLMQSASLQGGPILDVPDVRSLPRGGIIGVAEIVECVTTSQSPWFFGPYGFVLRNARPLPFHPCKGRLGFFDVDYPHEAAE